MGTMLILKAILLLGVASQSKNLAVSSTSTSEKPVTSTTTKSRRDFTTPPSSVNWSTESNNYRGKHYNVPYSSTTIPQESLQAETTVKTVIAPHPSQSVTYSPYQYYDGNHHSQNGPSAHGQIVQSTSTRPTLQGGFQASHDPRQQSATNGFQKSSLPYNSQSNQRVQNKLAPSGNHNSQYFANPSSYRLHSEPGKAAPQITLSSFSTSGQNGGSQHFPKYKTGSPARPNRQSPSGFGSFESLPKFRFNPSTTFNVQSAPLISSAQRSKNTIYKGNSYPGSKNIDISPTSFSSELSGAPSFKSFNKLGDNYQYSGAPSVGYANKQISIPDSVQFQNGPQVSGYIQAFENEPVLLSSGLDYQPQPSSGFSFELPKSNLASGGSASFTSGNYQPRILPVHSSSSTSQLPHYKGASINTFSNNEYAKPDGGYQLLANQPQLHFTSSIPLQSVGGHKPIVYHSNKPFEQIRTDVEVINKKRPPLPKPDDSYEHDFEGGFKIGKDIGHFTADSDDVSAPVKNPVRDISFELPSSNVFNSYDEAFGKYSKLASLEQDSVKVNPKPVYLSAEVDDDDKDDKSGEYHSSYSDGRAPASSYEDEDEEESRRSERLETRGERNQKKNDDDDDDDDDDESDAYKSYGVDFEKDFEESYRKELPKNDYVHIKEVPEIEEPTSESKKRTSNRSSPKTSRGGTKQKSRHVVQGEYEEPKEYESYTTHKYEKPKTTYRDSEGHGSKNSYRKTSGSEPVSEESYGYKVPRDRGTTRYTKRDNSEIKNSDEDQQQTQARKTSSNRDVSSPNRSYSSPKQSSNVQRSASPTLSPIELIKTYTFPPFSSAKAGKQPSSKPVSRATDSYGAPTLGLQAFVRPEEQSYRLPPVQREGLRYFTNGQVVRDLTGI